MGVASTIAKSIRTRTVRSGAAISGVNCQSSAAARGRCEQLMTGQYSSINYNASRDRLSGLADQLLVQFVEAHHRPQRVGRALVDVEHILHCGHKLRVLVRRDDPLRAQPRLELVFLSVSWMVWRDTRSTYPSSTIRSASNRSVQRVCPLGADEQASWTRRASALPSRRRS